MEMSSALCEVIEFGLKYYFLICFVPFSIVLPNLLLNLSQTVHVVTSFMLYSSCRKAHI